MTENPLDTLRKLIQRLGREADDIGLSLHHAAVMPNPDGDGPDVMQVVFAITPKAIEPEKSEADTELDAQFEEIIRGEQAAEREKKNQEAAQEIQGWLEGRTDNG